MKPTTGILLFAAFALGLGLAAGYLSAKPSPATIQPNAESNAQTTRLEVVTFFVDGMV